MTEGAVDIARAVDQRREEISKFLADLCSLPAVNPTFGGQGEQAKAQWLAGFLQQQGFDVGTIAAEDKRAAGGQRPNLVVRIPGKTAGGTLWFIGHMDTVAPGDRSDWENDPFAPVVRDDRIYGRGVEDNGQGIAGMVYAALVMKQLGLQPDRNIGLLFVSDEEAGSEFGLKFLRARGLFQPGDEALVPDGGTPGGSLVEVAEKTIIWSKFTVTGKEGHASMPELGVNASWVGSLLAVELINTLRSRFNDRNSLYQPAYSTFELTQKFANVDSPNVLPGKDMFVIDCRVLPQWKPDQVFAVFDQLLSRFEYAYKVRIGYELLQLEVAPEPTAADASIVTRLCQCLQQRGINPRVGGIGGGTCAAMLRAIGIPSVVWATLDETAHQPNEYCLIDNLLADTKTFIQLMLG